MRMYGSQRGSLAAAAVLKRAIFLTASHTRICISTNKSRENPYQVLQVTHAASERAMKSRVRMNKIIIAIAPSYTGKNITRLLPLAMLLMLCTRNNTDGNKLVIFSGIALYCGV